MTCVFPSIIGVLLSIGVVMDKALLLLLIEQALSRVTEARKMTDDRSKTAGLLLPNYSKKEELVMHCMA